MLNILKIKIFSSHKEEKIQNNYDHQGEKERYFTFLPVL